MNSVLLLIYSISLYLVYRVVKWRRRIAKIRRTMPVVPLLLEPWSLFRLLIPRRFQKYHGDWQFQNRGNHQNFGTDITPLIPLFGHDSIYVADADAVVEIATNERRFPKDLRLYGVLDIYGRNVVTTEGADWRMHRKITSRPFSERNNQLVHDESVRQATQMMAAWDSQSHSGAFVVEKPRSETMKFALHVISGAGFGVPFTWEKSSDDVWPQHTMSFRDAVHTLLTHLLAIVLLPKRILQLPLPWKELRRSEQAYREFGRYMHDLLEREKKLGKDSDGLNLMSALVKHSTSEDSAAELGVLQDDEIIGNTFVFLLAGHETTANTLMYAFTMLALHPQVQDTLVSEILQVCGDRVPTYGDFPNLVYPLCVMFETLRRFPPVVGIPKCTVNGEQTLLGKYYIPKNATVMYDAINLHHNPKYWGNDVDSFNPSRFDGRNLAEKAVERNIGDDAPGAKLDTIKMPQRGAFVPFSEGARSCLGRKFAQVEFVACLVMVMREWSIEVTDGWTPEMVRDALDRSSSTITLAPQSDIPLTFRRRSSR